ncbi:hypothetical protein BP5796_05648 [Coleophoma crateriformis]|uniref:AB hydrolase-1 domain-containing protein n=1 Tax=Coleophoma crateriformis TaxID=565419 RepID=A0A3D8S449_9HELO|nr:hypothetical protein BP5796_05648 [Coleophoma crateriformis]
MTEPSLQDWDKGDKSGLVSIGEHKLYVSINGPDRRANEPVVIVMQGLGSTIDEWVAVRRLTTPFVRFLTYDRSGLGKSESHARPLKAHTTVGIAHELDTLLCNLHLAPPYIVVGHSWGGVLARELLHLRPADIVGMVFVDANQETTFARHEEFPYACVQAIDTGIDAFEVTEERAKNVLLPGEFAAIERAQGDPRHQATTMAECEGFKLGVAVLAPKKQLEEHALGNHPVSVIHGRWTARHFQNTLDAAIRLGNGTEQDRREYQHFVDDWEANSGARMREILKLSRDPSLCVYRESTKSGHNIQFMEPEIIVEEIKRVYDLVVQRGM